VRAERGGDLPHLHVVERGDECAAADAAGDVDDLHVEPQILEVLVLGGWDPWRLVRF
jgi:hypothetical protein